MTEREAAKALQNELRETAELAKNVTRLALEATAAQIASGQHKDAAGAARNAGVVFGITVDKLHALQDRPPPPLDDDRDPKQIMLDLARRLGIIIDEPPRPIPELLPAPDAPRTHSSVTTPEPTPEDLTA